MTRRRYTRAEKAEAVAEAERTSLTAASERLDVPLNTLKYWLDHPDFAEVRTKTREELAEGSIAMAVVAQGELIRRIRSGKISDQALVAAFGVGIDKAQLLSGAATSRTESRALTDPLDDHEKATLRDIIDQLEAESEPKAEESPTG